MSMTGRHHVKGVCPWSPVQRGGGGAGWKRGSNSPRPHGFNFSGAQANLPLVPPPPLYKLHQCPKLIRSLRLL